MRLAFPDWLPARDAAAALALGAGYFVVAALTVHYTRFDGGVPFVWPATALLLAHLILTPRHRWPSRLVACWVASLLTTSLYGLGPRIAPAMASVNIADAAIGAWLLTRSQPRFGGFRSLAEVGAFLASAGVIAPASTAFLGAACAVAVTQTAYWTDWLNWYTGHALGTMIFAPLLILSFRGEASGVVREAGGRGVAHAAVLLALVAGTTTLVFAQNRLPMLFLPFFPMMIAVFRLGRFGAVVSSVIIALIGTAFTLQGLGPISLIVGGAGAHAQFFQLYLATAVLMVLPAAAELEQRKAMFVALQETSALQQLVLDRTSDIIMRLELDGTVAYVSPSIRRVCGYTPEQLIGRQPHALIDAQDVDAVIATHRRALASPSETFIVEYRARHENGETGWFETHTRATVDEDGRPTGVVSIIHDVTQRKAELAELELRAGTDPLTGLANRRTFDAQLADTLGEARAGRPAGCVALFDLDRFKTINDHHGHATGDTVLRQFADIMRAAVRGDDVVARYGGEEFVVLLAGASSEEGSAICERVRTRFEALEIRDDQRARIHATVSAGLAPIEAGASADLLLKAADAALYRSKAAGRNRLTLAA